MNAQAEMNFEIKDPKPNTKIYKILQYLKQGHSITQKEAIDLFYSYRLSDVIFTLKNRGWNIESTMVTNGTSNFASYKMKGAR